MNLRPLCRASQSAHDSILVSMAQINLRSLVNKTFILNDLFTSRNLDFLFVTKTSQNVGDLSSFIEFVPPDCASFNSPRTTGHGGGLASVFFWYLMNMATQWILSYPMVYLYVSVKLLTMASPITSLSSFKFSFQDLLLNHVHLHTCTVNCVTVLDFCYLYNNGSFFYVNHEFSPSQLSAEELLSSLNLRRTSFQLYF